MLVLWRLFSGLLLGFVVLKPLQAQQYGVAYYAIQSARFPCERSLAVFDGLPNPALSVLWETFGSRQECLQSFLNNCITSRDSCTLQIHPTNEYCRRHRVCAKHEVMPALDDRQINRALELKDRRVLAAYRSRVRRITNFVRPYSGTNVSFLLSTGLEDNYSPRAARILISAMRSIWPYSLVRVVKAKREREQSGTEFFEIHGIKPRYTYSAQNKSCIFNNDGRDVVLGTARTPQKRSVTLDDLRLALEKYRETCPLLFVWWNNQGAVRRPWEGFTFPHQRSIEILSEDVQQVNTLLLEFSAQARP